MTSDNPYESPQVSEDSAPLQRPWSTVKVLVVLFVIGVLAALLLLLPAVRYSGARRVYDRSKMQDEQPVPPLPELPGNQSSSPPSHQP
jgi:hypothetical protein